MKQHNRVCATVDLDAVSHNMEQMRERLGGKASLIAVVKADGYGHGAIPIAKMFEEYPYVWGYAVACLDEAVQLREHGLKKPVLVLGCVFPDQYEEMVRLDIRPTVYTEEMAGQISEEAVRQGKKVRLHIKADTGMARLGFPVNGESADVIRRISALPNVELEGMFTHFAKADETDKTYTLMQHERFLEMIKLTKERGVTITYYDCDNSAGIIDFPDMKHDLARAGIAMYGMYPSGDVDKSAVDLRPALTLTSHVSFVKEIEPGTAVSYGGTFVAEKKMRVATIPVGYGDGYPRSLSNKGDVLIRGRRAKIIGRICMDQFMVDVTDIPDTGFMDTVTLIGRDGDECITVEELAALSGRFHYEFVCCLGRRIPRVYKRQGRLFEAG
ncbi:MAG TPA: alanine racemase [Candidatus Mediterraneibacter merdipullorum]|nr:alanine racemase [Candidatus Mediterraneibacter merdipullorum]